MYLINDMKLVVLVFLLSFGMSLHAETDLDKLLLEMDTLAEEVDSMTLDSVVDSKGIGSPKETKESVKTESTSPVITSKPVKSEALEVNKNKVSDKKEKAIQAEVIKKPNNETVKVVVEKTVINDVEKEKESKDTPPEDKGDGFGDFEISQQKLDADEDLSQGRTARSRDPFAPSAEIVSDYQKKIEEENIKREEIRLARQKELNKGKELEEKKKETAKMLADQATALKAKLVQARALALPKMKLKGFIRKPNQGVLALLDIKGLGTHIVRQGDRVNLGSFGAIRILSIDNMSLKIETSDVDKTIVVR